MFHRCYINSRFFAYQITHQINIHTKSQFIDHTMNITSRKPLISYFVIKVVLGGGNNITMYIKQLSKWFHYLSRHRIKLYINKLIMILCKI